MGDGTGKEEGRSALLYKVTLPWEERETEISPYEVVVNYLSRLAFNAFQ